MLKIIRATSLLLVGVALQACGGGGGGGDQPPSNPPNNPPNNQPSNPPAAFQLTDANAPAAASLVLRGVEQLVTSASLLNSARGLLESGGRNQTTIGASCGATIGGFYRYVDSNMDRYVSAGERLTISLPLCNGIAREIEIDVTDATQSLEGNVRFDVSYGTPTTRLVGTFALSHESSHQQAGFQQIWAISNASFDVSTGGTTHRVSVPSVMYANGFDQSLGPSYAVTFNGSVTGAEAFVFSTPAALAGTYFEFPTTGDLLLTAGASKARFVGPPAENEEIGEFRVDPNGAGYGPAQPQDWRTLLTGSLFGWVDNDPPAITQLEFEPANPTSVDPIKAVYKVQDRESDPVFFDIEWRRNGVILYSGFPGETLATYYAYVKGDRIEVTVTARDSHGRTRATRSVTIANAAPAIEGTATLSPASPDTTHDITASAAATDSDGDALTYSYAWRRNGTPLTNQTAPVLPQSAHQRGDTVTAVVTASDGSSSSSTEVSVTIGDAPPRITAVSAPGSAPYGMPLTFDTNVADPDGDSVSGLQFALAYGPAGMTVNPATGLVSWQPGGPMFDRTLDVRWGVTVNAPRTVDATGTIRVDDPTRRYPLMRTHLAPALWPAGLTVGDFDGDGDEEALILSTRGLYELASDGAGSYRQAWMYPFAFTDREDPYDTPDITAFATGDVDQDGRDEIFVAARGLIGRLDGEHRRLVATASIGEYVECNDLQLGDLDRDGGQEIVCVEKTSVHFNPEGTLIVLRADDLSLRWQAPLGRWGQSIALGNVDDDAALEIVTAGGFVIDGQSLATQWNYVTAPGNDYGFGFDVHTADMDDDGVAEIVAAVDWTAPVRVYDARTQTVEMEIVDSGDVGALGLGDVDGDGTPEIFVGNGQYGAIRAYRVVGNGLQMWDEIWEQSGVAGIAVGDLDDDGAPDVIWSMSDERTIQVASVGATLNVEWATGVLPYGPFFGGELAGSPLAPKAPLFLSLRNGGGTILTPARLVAMDPTTGDFMASPELGWNANNDGAMIVADSNLDGTDEAVFPDGDGYSTRILAYDFFTSQDKWTTGYDSQQYSYAVAFARGDLNGDGRDEIASISLIGRVDVYDHLGARVWSSTTLGGGRDVVIADLDDDGVRDIIAVAANRLYVYERVSGPVQYVQTGVYDAPPTDQSITDMRQAAVADTNGDGEVELIVLEHDPYTYEDSAQVERLDADLNVLSRFTVPWRATALAVEPGPGPSSRNLVLPTGYGIGGASRLVAVDARSGSEVWRSPLLRAPPRSNSLNYVQLPGAPAKQITIATDNSVYLTR